MPGQRQRRWPNIKTALGEYPVFAGIEQNTVLCTTYHIDNVKVKSALSIHLNLVTN